MVTGSHIPFDRNGIKINKSVGELLKSDEPGIILEVERKRAAGRFTRSSNDGVRNLFQQWRRRAQPTPGKAPQLRIYAPSDSNARR